MKNLEPVSYFDIHFTGAISSAEEKTVDSKICGLSRATGALFLEKYVAVAFHECYSFCVMNTRHKKFQCTRVVTVVTLTDKLRPSTMKSKLSAYIISKLLKFIFSDVYG